MQTTSASAPAGVDVVCSMSLCSIKVILIYIPVRSAGGGLLKSIIPALLGSKWFWILLVLGIIGYNKSKNN